MSLGPAATRVAAGFGLRGRSRGSAKSIESALKPWEISARVGKFAQAMAKSCNKTFVLWWVEQGDERDCSVPIERESFHPVGKTISWLRGALLDLLGLVTRCTAECYEVHCRQVTRCTAGFAIIPASVCSATRPVLGA